MTSYQIYILPNSTDKYSNSVLDLLKKHEYSSVIITSGDTSPFLQRYVSEAFFIKNTPINENLIIEEITKRKPVLVVIDNFLNFCKLSITENMKENGIDPLLNRVLHCSIQLKNIKIIQVIPVSMIEPSFQRFGMAEKIHCSSQYRDDVFPLKLSEYIFKVRFFNEKDELGLINALPINTPVAKITDIEPCSLINSIYKKEFNLYQNIYTIHNRTELLLFIQHLREINNVFSQDVLVQIINETSTFLNKQPDTRKSIGDEDKNEYIYKISSFIQNVSKVRPYILDEILGFFTPINCK